MKLIATVLLALSMAGCSSIPFFANAKNRIEALIDAKGAGIYVITVTKNGEVLYNQRWECIPSPDRTLPDCEKVQPQ